MITKKSIMKNAVIQSGGANEAGICNIGIIGTGAFMQRQHLPNLAAMPGVRIKAICDINKATLSALMKSFSIDYATDCDDEIFMDQDIDAVVIGTRNDFHTFFLKKAVKYNKHIWIEKPMASSYAETAEILRCAKGFSKNIAVGFNRRFAPSMIETKKIFNGIKEGPANIIYRIVDDHRLRPAYIFDMYEGGGHILQEACHIFDLLSWLLDAEPVSVFCAGGISTDNIITLKFSDESLCTIICGGKGSPYYPKELLEIFCNNTTIVLDSFFELRVADREKNCMKHFAFDLKTPVISDVRNMSEFYQTLNEIRLKYDPGDQKIGSLPIVNKGHNEAMTDFVEKAKYNGNFSINCIDGARATICALKAYDSLRHNSSIKIFQEEYGLF